MVAEPAPSSSLSLSQRLAAAGLMLLIVLAGLFGAFEALEQPLRDARFAATSRAPSGDVVLVEIDSPSLAAFGVWPWPREVHAAVLDRLVALGAYEVLFDIDFSTVSNEASDARFAAALEAAGGFAYLAAFQQLSSTGQVILNQPLPRFAAHAMPVLVNVDGDGTGLITSTPGYVGASKALVSAANALSPGSAVEERIVIDYGIDLHDIDRVGVADLFAPGFDASRIAGRQVVVGASAVELRDFFRVPRFGVIPGPLVQIAAAETLKAGRQLRELAAWPTGLLALGLGLFYLLVLRQWKVGSLAIGAILVGLGLEAISLVALNEVGLLVDTLPFHLAAGAFLLMTLVAERASRWRSSQEQQARIAYLAEHDLPTGALSRQALIARLAAQTAPRLAIVDIDRLEAVVTSFGHRVADAVLAETARRLQAALGALPARVGEASFAFVIEAGEDADELLLDVASKLEPAFAVEGHQIHLATRFGVGSDNAASTAMERLREAEIALVTARQGSLKLAHYQAELGQAIQLRRRMDVDMRRGLERGEFFLLYQPQVLLGSQALVGVEALVRWSHPELGLVSPAQFIPLAEESGLILGLGEWVMNQACQDAASWAWHGRMSVNVSAAQFRLGDVPAMVGRALERSGLAPERLDIEITESLMADDSAALMADLEALRQRGTTLALDDFGTGYSSLSYLTRLPIDKIKIDQAFVRSLPNPQNQAIIRAIVELGQFLDKAVIAEGVETAEQQAILIGTGCTLGQGYLFGRPQTALQLGLGGPIEQQAARA